MRGGCRDGLLGSPSSRPKKKKHGKKNWIPPFISGKSKKRKFFTPEMFFPLVSTEEGRLMVFGKLWMRGGNSNLL